MIFFTELLVQEDGEPKVRKYTMSGQTPWEHRDQPLSRFASEFPMGATLDLAATFK